LGEDDGDTEYRGEFTENPFALGIERRFCYAINL